MNGVETICDQEARDLARKAMARMEAHEALCTERWNTSRATGERVEAAVTLIKDNINRRLGLAPATFIAGAMTVIGFLAAHFH